MNIKVHSQLVYPAENNPRDEVVRVIFFFLNIIFFNFCLFKIAYVYVRRCGLVCVFLLLSSFHSLCGDSFHTIYLGVHWCHPTILFTWFCYGKTACAVMVCFSFQSCEVLTVSSLNLTCIELKDRILSYPTLRVKM